MKKIYFAPELVVVKINPTTVICTSSLQSATEDEVDGIAETSEFRQRHLWDDNWD